MGKQYKKAPGIAGLREPTEDEKKAIWGLLGGYLHHDACAANVAAVSSWAISVVVFFAAEYRAIVCSLEPWKIQILLFGCIMLALASCMLSKHAVSSDRAIGIVAKGRFQVAKVYSVRFSANTRGMFPRGYVWIHDENGVYFSTPFVIDAGIAVKYQDEKEVPFLYIKSMDGKFFTILAKEDVNCFVDVYGEGAKNEETEG